MRSSRIAGVSSAPGQDDQNSSEFVTGLPAQLLPVLRQLSPETFLSGEDIAQRLGCSRATVNNAIRAAQDAGFTVHAVHGRGYRLAAPVSWLDADRLAQVFAPRGITLRHLDQVASTNALMLEWAASGETHAAPSGLPMRAAHRSLLTAEWQAQGRGRRGRDWHAGLGGGLMFSFLWRSGRPAAQLSGLVFGGWRGLGEWFARNGPRPRPGQMAERYSGRRRKTGRRVDRAGEPINMPAMCWAPAARSSASASMFLAARI